MGSSLISSLSYMLVLSMLRGADQHTLLSERRERGITPPPLAYPIPILITLHRRNPSLTHVTSQGCQSNGGGEGGGAEAPPLLPLAGLACYASCLTLMTLSTQSPLRTLYAVAISSTLFHCAASRATAASPRAVTGKNPTTLPSVSVSSMTSLA